MATASRNGSAERPWWGVVGLPVTSHQLHYFEVKWGRVPGVSCVSCNWKLPCAFRRFCSVMQTVWELMVGRWHTWRAQTASITEAGDVVGHVRHAACTLGVPSFLACVP